MTSGHGIARYAKELYAGIRRLESEFNIVPVSTWSDRKGNDLNDFIESTGLNILPGGSKFLPLAWKYFNYPNVEQCLRSEVDLVHALSPGYPLATRKPYLVTVHDIGPLTHKQFFTKKDQWLMQASIKQAVRHADGIICVSHSTAKDLQNYVQDTYREDLTDRIRVIHEGVDSDFGQPVKTIEIPDIHLIDELKGRPYLLTVGKISPRKNLDLVLNSFKDLTLKFPDHQLLTVGGDGWDFQQVKQRAGEYGIQKSVHFLGYVSDELLKHLYAHTEVFIYPSLFEGFGLTLLEAMACGAPVVTSNISSMPEIAGDAAILIDPKNQHDLTDKLIQLLSDSTMKCYFREKGISRASDFDWQHTATKTLEFYNNII
ncbi:glycosyltransferase family 4 protein [Aureitalea marina]|nr:glycosyltransferase family 1 protein [Aureitalea marina]